MTTSPLPTVAEMRAIREGPQSVFLFHDFAFKHWPAIIAMRERIEAIENESAEWETVGGAFALVWQLRNLERQLAEKNAECERLRAEMREDKC